MVAAAGPARCRKRVPHLRTAKLGSPSAEGSEPALLGVLALFAVFWSTHTRRAGAVLLAGLPIAAVFGIGASWLS
jgi:hypothetical protein